MESIYGNYQVFKDASELIRMRHLNWVEGFIKGRWEACPFRRFLGMIKKLLNMQREYGRESRLAAFLVVVEVSIEMLIPFLMALIIDRGIYGQDIGAILRYGGLLILCAGTTLTMGIFSGQMAARASAGFAKNIRHDVFHKIQEFSFHRIDEFSRASLISRLTTDVSNIQVTYQAMLRIVVRAPMMMVVSFTIIAMMNVQLSLIFVAIVPLLGALVYTFIRRSRKIYARVFKHYDTINNVVSENLNAIRFVKSTTSESREMDKLERATGDLYDDFTKAEKLLTFNLPVSQLSIYACILFISFFGAHLVVGGDLTTGQLMSIFTYAFQILMGLMVLTFWITMYVGSLPAITRIMEVMDAKIDIRDDELALGLDEVKSGNIRFEGVNFRYKKDAPMALEGINLDVPSGSTVGIIGISGSGKTTLVSLISRLYDAEDGAVYVDDGDVRGYKLKHLRDAVAVVLQKNMLFSGSVRENLQFGNPKATEEEIKQSCDIAQASEFIEKMPEKYDTKIDELGTNLSGGQKQRITIARALVKKPSILILDDSTSAVDVATEREIFASFKQYMPNVTKLVVSARVASIKDMDQIIVMNEGRIDAVGTHEAVMATSQIYADIYKAQQEWEVDNLDADKS